jgi:histone-binding protein RBBP4
MRSYGLAWSPLKRGHLLSAGDDERICLWDIQAASRDNRSIKSQQSFAAHTDIVEVSAV